MAINHRISSWATTSGPAAFWRGGQISLSTFNFGMKKKKRLPFGQGKQWITYTNNARVCCGFFKQKTLNTSDFLEQGQYYSWVVDWWQTSRLVLVNINSRNTLHFKQAFLHLPRYETCWESNAVGQQNLVLKI